LNNAASWKVGGLPAIQGAPAAPPTASSSPSADIPPPPAGAATVVFYRPSKFVVGAVGFIVREQSRLDAALNAARRRHGRIVSIEGEAGIGKTSLVLSFVEGHRSDARVYVGGCEHLTTPEPLGPLRDIARDSQGRFAVSASGQIATFEALLHLLTSGREAALLVIEDIHWADDPTLDLLRYLGRRIRAAPILTVVTFRNDEVASHARLASLSIAAVPHAEPLQIGASSALYRLAHHLLGCTDHDQCALAFRAGDAIHRATPQRSEHVGRMLRACAGLSR
jgi:hypothetical protein